MLFRKSDWEFNLVCPKGKILYQIVTAFDRDTQKGLSFLRGHKY